MRKRVYSRSNIWLSNQANTASFFFFVADKMLMKHTSSFLLHFFWIEGIFFGVFVKVFEKNHILKRVSSTIKDWIWVYQKSTLGGIFECGGGLIWNWSGARAGTKEISSFLFWHWDETGFNQTLLLSPTGNYPLLKASIG